MPEDPITTTYMKMVLTAAQSRISCFK